MSDRKSQKQAVVILHGMGEQIPMETLEGFVKAVWMTDLSLSDMGKPDPDTGARPRQRNAAWGKPDPCNHSFELRRITTEAAKNGRMTDFYEYYWADLMYGTTWEQVRAWIVDLLWRNPWRRVPRKVLSAWVLLWVTAIAAAAVAIIGVIPPEPSAGPGPLRAILGGLTALAITGFVSNVLVKRFGDVARYVKALPPNVARRQEIRSNGVQLLEELMNSTRDGKPQYDRIIVVAHSLGTIVAYDILTQLFARHNDKLAGGCTLGSAKQPKRDALEQMIRRAAGLPVVEGVQPAPPSRTGAAGIPDAAGRMPG